jgi:hypothetical protein
MIASLRALARRTALLALLLTQTPSIASAQQEEASLLFERGNQHLARGLRARGRARERELGQALDAYLGVLRLGARTRNVVFNVALTLTELGRDDEAFNYFSEYLHAFDLSAEDRAEGERRIDALRPRVAVLHIESTPEGAEVRLDRRDLPVRGATPLELAVAAGPHRVFATREGYAEASASATATLGASARVELTLAPSPIDVQVIAPAIGTLTLDGEPIEAGHHVPVAPGSHVVRLEVPNAPPIERRFEVAPGADPLALELSAPAAATSPELAIAIDTPAEIFVDSVRAAQGENVELPVQPGPHVIRVVAPRHTTLVHRVTLGVGDRLALRVHLGRRADATGLDAARTTFGVLSAVGLGVWAGLAVRALDLSNAWNADVARHNHEAAQMRPPTDSQAMLIARGHAVEDAALMADLALGVTAALAITTLALLIAGPGDDEPSSVQIGAAPTAHGGLVTAQLRWGL